MRSEVDENLFGQPNRVKQAQQLRDAKSSKIFKYLFFLNFINYKSIKNIDSNVDLRKSNEYSPERTNQKKSGAQSKEYIKHITKDLIREIL